MGSAIMLGIRDRQVMRAASVLCGELATDIQGHRSISIRHRSGVPSPAPHRIFLMAVIHSREVKPATLEELRGVPVPFQD